MRERAALFAYFKVDVRNKNKRFAGDMGSVVFLFSKWESASTFDARCFSLLYRSIRQLSMVFMYRLGTNV